jgi:hypothetical protein
MEFADSFEMAQGILEKQDRRVTLTKSRTTRSTGVPEISRLVAQNAFLLMAGFTRRADTALRC